MNQIKNPDLTCFLANRVCANEQLTSLFREYLRINATCRETKQFIKDPSVINCLKTLRQTALATFLAEASRSFPIEELNNETDQFLAELTRRLG